MNICFVAAGSPTWMSSRVRCYWPARYLGATVLDVEGLSRKGLPPADVYIWQKKVRLDLVAATPGAQHWWDVTEPLWWFEPEESAEILAEMTGVVANTQALADDLAQWKHGRSCHVIPDRLEPSYFTRYRVHQQVAPVRFIWFGTMINRVALAPIWPNLIRLRAEGLDVELTLMDNRPELPLQFGPEVPLYYTKWMHRQELDVLASHDIALLPPLPGPWGEIRGNAKALAAWACRLPVTNGRNYELLKHLVTDPEAREERGRAGQEEVARHWTSDRSAAQWETLLEEAAPLGPAGEEE